MKDKVRKLRNSLLSLMMTLALTAASFAALPEAAYAAGSTDIAAGDLIELGSSEAAGYTGVPLWRVLDKADDGSMLLMSEYLWKGNGSDNANAGITFAADLSKPVGEEWNDTLAFKWCDKFEEAVLGDAEGMTIKKTTVNDREYTYKQTLYGKENNKTLSFASAFMYDEVYFLSAEELVKYMPEPADRKAYMYGSENTDAWLLRSTETSTGNRWAGVVNEAGEISSVNARTGKAARPVFWAKFGEGLSFTSANDENGRRVFSIAENQALESARSEAAAQLKSIDTSAYSGEDKAAAEAIIAEALNAIENASDEDAVGKALSAAKEKLGSCRTDAEKAGDNRIGEDTEGSKSGGGKEAGTGTETKTKTRASKAKTVTVNVPVVSAAAVNKAVKAKGSSRKHVTKIILGSRVKTIKPKAFAKYGKVKVIELRTKKLTGKSVRKSLKGSKVKTIKVKAAKKAAVNRKYVTKYRKIFTKKNAGRKVSVKK